jgi:hypothetical protein
MFFNEDQVKKIVKESVIANRERVFGKHSTSAHLYNLKEGVTPEGTYKIHFFSSGGIFHNCWIAFTLSDEGLVWCDHCWDEGMVKLEDMVFSQLEHHFKAQGVITQFEFEDVIHENRLRGRKRKLRILDEYSLIDKPGDLSKDVPEDEGTESAATPQIPHDVFVSYSSLDKTIANAVVARLERHKIRCWIAPRDILPGINYQVSLVNAIKTCTIMVLVFTQSSNRSAHVTREVNIAVDAGAIIIPFRIQDVPLSQEMQYLVAAQHWLDAMTPPLEERINELCQSVQTLLKEPKKRMLPE